MPSAAWRRHHTARKKAKVRHYAVCQAYDYAMVPDARYGVRQVRVRGPYPTDDPARLGQMARTPHPCSCWSCGSPRKWFGQVTTQERKAPRLDDWD